MFICERETKLVKGKTGGNPSKGSKNKKANKEWTKIEKAMIVEATKLRDARFWEYLKINKQKSVNSMRSFTERFAEDFFILFFSKLLLLFIFLLFLTFSKQLVSTCQLLCVFERLLAKLL